MLSGFGTLLDRLQGLLGKGFLLAGFVPLVVLILLNLALLHWISPKDYKIIAAFVEQPENNTLFFWIRLVLIVFVASLALWSVNPWLRQFLEAKILWEPIRLQMIASKNDKVIELETELKRLEKEIVAYRKLDTNLKLVLKNARIQGQQQSADIKGQITDPVLLEDFKKLEKLRRDWEPISYSTICDVFNKLVKELESKSADHIPSLNRLHVEFVKLVEECRSHLENWINRKATDLQQRYPSDYGRLGPTQMANLSEVHREYGLKRFGLDIEYFWIRLLKVIREDSQFYPILEEAKTQLDFAVAITMVLGVTCFAWIVPSMYAESPFPLIVVFGIGPLLVYLFYQITVQTYRGFTETVRSAIDLHRFKVLELLHLDLPADAEQEKRLWESLMRGKKEDGQPITYRHPGQPVIPAFSEAPVKRSYFKKLLSWLGIK